LCRDALFKHPAKIEFEGLTGVKMKSMVFWLINAVYFRDIPMFQRSTSSPYSLSKLHGVRIQKTIFFVPHMVSHFSYYVFTNKIWNSSRIDATTA
jgi:hypothetical protein